MLAVRGLRVTYAGGVQALRGIDLEVAPGEALAVVGESGCGRAPWPAAVLRLLPADGARGGEGRPGGQRRLRLGDRGRGRMRGRSAGLVVQDPMGASTR